MAHVPNNCYHCFCAMNLKFPLKTRLLQYACAITCSLGTLSGGFHFGWPSPYIPVLLGEESPIPIDKEVSSWVAIIYLVGGFVSVFVTAIFVDIVGRKKVLLLSGGLLVISWILVAFAKSLVELLIARFLGGFSDGLMFGVTPIYFGEISDPEVRGLLGCSVTIAHLLGTMLVNIIGSYYGIHISAMMFLPVPIIFCVLLMWMPESPNFYLIKGNKKGARKSMVALKGPQEADCSLQLVARAIEQENLDSRRFVLLFSRINGRCLLIIVGLRMMQQFSGFVAFTFYAQTLFKEAGDSISPLVSVTILYAVQIIFSLISSTFVDKMGRKPLLIVSTVGSGISLLAEGFFFFTKDILHQNTTDITWLPTVVLVVFVISFSVGLQAIPLFMGAEMFPTNVKAYASAVSNASVYVFALVASKYFQFTKDEYGMHVPFFTFAACCIIGLIIICCFVPETKNKTLEEIQVELRSKN